MCLRGLSFKKLYFQHIVHYCCSSLRRTFWNSSIYFLQSSSFWKALCALIGRISQACDGNVTPLPYLETHSIYSVYNTTVRTKVKHLGIIMQIFQHSVDLWERVMRRFLEGIDES